MDIRKQLDSRAEAGGADLWGVADLEPLLPELGEAYGDYLTRLPRAISLAVIFPPEVIRQLRSGPTHTYLHYYRVVNVRLDDLVLGIANWLYRQGYCSFPVPASQRVGGGGLRGIFPHRLAAARAGLGWIGRSGCLVTPQWGPAVRLGTVLTDAPLPPDQPQPEQCGTCQACVRACPAAAIAAADEPGDERVEAELCDRHLSRVRSQFGKRVCGMCLAVCPWIDGRGVAQAR